MKNNARLFNVVPRVIMQFYAILLKTENKR